MGGPLVEKSAGLPPLPQQPLRPPQPPLRPPLQYKEAEQVDEAALANDSKYVVERDDILEVALANEIGLD